MSSITIEKLYTNYDILSQAKGKIGEHTKEYEEIISGVKGGDKEKKLASQFIAKFFKHFPSLHYQAIEALFDICEDDDMNIRKQAMKVLPSLCKDTKEHTTKVADVLAQLLQLEDPQEHTIASNALIEVIKIDPLPALKGFFKQVLAGEYLVREKCIKFLSSKIQVLDTDILTKEVEDYIISEVKKIILLTSSDNFVCLMEFLKSTRFSETAAGKQELIDIVAEQIELNAPFEPLDKENDIVDRFCVCVQYIMPYFSEKYDPIKFVEYICDKILPQYEIIGTISKGPILQDTILKQLAEMSTYCGPLKNPTQQVENVFERLKAFLPLPPEDIELTTMPELDFSTLECLIYTFHKLAKQCPEFLESDASLLKDFRIRLQYFARCIQGCIAAIKNATGEHSDKKKKIYLACTTNINTLIKDLFYSPPSYKSVITLSWKPEKTIKKQQVETANKRHAPITIDFDRNAPAHKLSRKTTENQQLYTPPSGKFSNHFQSQNRNLSRNRGRSGTHTSRNDRGGIRGRARGRRGNWRN